MTRKARCFFPGVPVHLIQRGHNKGRCFFDERDFQVYLGMLAQIASDQRCFIHAYVLMTNHVHMLLTGEDLQSPSLLMKNLGQRYVQYVNRKQERRGTLWEGRFHSCTVLDERYLLTCYLYIESNPVRAGMVAQPGDYTWSSYRHNAEGIESSFVAPHSVYRRLGRDEQSCRATYRGLFETPLNHSDLADIREATYADRAL